MTYSSVVLCTSAADFVCPTGEHRSYAGRSIRGDMFGGDIFLEVLDLDTDGHLVCRTGGREEVGGSSIPSLL